MHHRNCFFKISVQNVSFILNTQAELRYPNMEATSC